MLSSINSGSGTSLGTSSPIRLCTGPTANPAPGHRGLRQMRLVSRRRRLGLALGLKVRKVARVLWGVSWNFTSRMMGNGRSLGLLVFIVCIRGVVGSFLMNRMPVCPLFLLPFHSLGYVLNCISTSAMATKPYDPLNLATRRRTNPQRQANQV